MSPALPNPTVPAAPAQDVGVFVGSTHLSHLVHDEFTRPYGGTGLGTVHMRANDPQRSLIVEGADLTWKHWGTGALLFKGVVDDVEVRVVDEREDSSEILVIKASGTPGLWRRAMVYPQNGIQQFGPGPLYGLRIARAPLSSQRIFNWATPQLSYAGWPNAVERYQMCSTASMQAPPVGRFGKPDGWLDYGAYFIWSRALAGDGNDPLGTCYFRTAVSVAESTSASIDIAADDAFKLYVDGIPVLFFDSPPSVEGWAKTHTVEVGLSPGVHHIGVAATNHYFAGGPNGGGLIASVRTQPSVFQSSGGGEVVLANTNSSWRCLDYPSTPPSWTPGGIFLQLVAEAHARLYDPIPDLVCDFDATVDSNGTPWPPTGEFALRVGDTYEQVLGALGQTWVEWDMPPNVNAGRTLRMWVTKDAPLAGWTGWPSGAVAPGHGTTTGVTIAKGVNAKSIVHRSWSN